MKVSTKRCVAGFVALLFCLITVWLSGYNFGERSPFTAGVFVFSVFVSLYVASFPFNPD